jgi:hypothetical protein
VSMGGGPLGGAPSGAPQDWQELDPGSAPLQRSQAATVEVSDLRLEELRVFERRLEHLSDQPHGRYWRPFGWTLIGASLGGVVAGIPMFGSDQDWSAWVLPVYAVAVVVLFVIGLLALLAAKTTEGERGDSLTALKEEYRTMLNSWRGPDEPGASR